MSTSAAATTSTGATLASVAGDFPSDCYRAGDLHSSRVLINRNVGGSISVVGYEHEGRGRFATAQVGITPATAREMAYRLLQLADECEGLAR